MDFTTADKPTFTGTLHAGGSLTPVIPDPSADDNSVAVTWENWRVDGNCPIDTATGVVSASAEKDVCAIFVTAAAPNYDSLELEIISLTVSSYRKFWRNHRLRFTDGKLTLRELTPSPLQPNPPQPEWKQHHLELLGDRPNGIPPNTRPRKKFAL